MDMNNENLTLPVMSGPVDKIAITDLVIVLRRGVFPVWLNSRENLSGHSKHGFFADQLRLSSKEDYLVFRDRLKSLIRILAANQRLLNAAMRESGGCSESQFLKARNARVITLLIEIRRAGKEWSAMQARQRFAAAVV